HLSPVAEHECVPSYLESLPTDDDDPLRTAYVHLTHTFRQQNDKGGRQIRALATTLLDGDSDSLFSPTGGITPIDELTALPFMGAAHCAQPLSSPDGQSFLRHFAKTRIYDGTLLETARAGIEADDVRLDALVQQSTNTRFLCLTHDGAAGVEFLNQTLLACFTARRDDSARDTPGCPILVLENDDSSGLYNGDQGVIARVKDTAGIRLEALFPTERGVRRVPTALLPKVAPCFAMTVHKSQGSEYDHVLLTLPPPGARLLTRQLVYTAVTRARRSVTLLGPEASLRQAAETPAERSSRLRARVLQRLDSRVVATRG
ncbi:MAG: ATP-dependent DNA helicase, partial [Myxococcota bacterium]